MYLFLANIVLATHVLIVLFVVSIVPLVFLGKQLSWRWVRIYWLRVVHLTTMIIVAGQSWFGIVCPLTTLEMWLRAQADASTYSAGFIEYWLQKILFWNLPAWFFILLYSFFAMLVIMTWLFVPPQRIEKSNNIK